jgi:predicted RNA polymerase sigma factor
VLAQYRAATLLEKLGRMDEAQAAYRAVGEIAADDSYSKKLKEEAQKKLANPQPPK